MFIDDIIKINRSKSQFDLNLDIYITKVRIDLLHA